MSTQGLCLLVWSTEHETGRCLPAAQSGVPRKGAEYLAANIQQESSWNGMCSWGGVYNPTTGQWTEQPQWWLGVLGRLSLTILR